MIFLQFASSTFYDPARRALEPLLVPKRQLHLATTLDTFAWSVTVALGSSLGGAVVSKLGTTMCFVLDSFTFLCAAICVLILQVKQCFHQAVHVLYCSVSACTLQQYMHLQCTARRCTPCGRCQHRWDAAVIVQVKQPTHIDMFTKM